MSQVDLVGFSCAACGKQYRWKPELAGKTVRCKCGSPVTVPRQQSAPTASQARAVATAPGLAAAARAAEVPPRSARPAGAVPPPPPPPPRRATAAAVPPPPARRPQEAYDDPFGDNAGGGQDGGDLDALAALAQQEAAVADDAVAGADMQFCANCRSRMSPQAVLCTSCGYDRRKGAVLAAARVKDPNKRFFGLLKAKKRDPNKPVDKMAPQGSFMVGVAVSFALAIVAAIPWVAVAFGAEVDVYILVALIGVGAGVGMQLGQKGYSTLGGFTAAGITVLVMFMARLSVILLVFLPLMQRAAAAAAAEDREAGAAELLETALVEGAAEEGQSTVDREAAKEDPRVIAVLTDRMYEEMKIDPKFATFDQHTAAAEHAKFRATTMPSVEKEKLIAVADAKQADGKLHMYYVREYISQYPPDKQSLQLYQAAEGQAGDKVAKLGPEERKAELARLEAKFKTADEAERKAVAGADDDGLGGGDASEADELAMDEDDDAAADAGDGLEADGLADAGEDEGDEDASAGAGSAVAATAAPGGTVAEEEDDGPGLVSFGLTVILILIFFGNFKSFFFIVGALLLAYRTAAGATWG